MSAELREQMHSRSCTLLASRGAWQREHRSNPCDLRDLLIPGISSNLGVNQTFGPKGFQVGSPEAWPIESGHYLE